MLAGSAGTVFVVYDDRPSLKGPRKLFPWKVPGEDGRISSDKENAADSFEEACVHPPYPMSSNAAFYFCGTHREHIAVLRTLVTAVSVCFSYLLRKQGYNVTAWVALFPTARWECFAYRVRGRLQLLI